MDSMLDWNFTGKGLVVPNTIKISESPADSEQQAVPEQSLDLFKEAAGLQAASKAASAASSSVFFGGSGASGSK